MHRNVAQFLAHHPNQHRQQTTKRNENFIQPQQED
jgi:hypothetical protein